MNFVFCYMLYTPTFLLAKIDTICCRHCFRPPPPFFFLNAISLSIKWKIIIVKLFCYLLAYIFWYKVGMKDLLKLCFEGFFHREELWPKGLLSAHHPFTLLQYSQSFFSPRKCIIKLILLDLETLRYV